MKEFMVEVVLPTTLTQEFILLIPSQRAYIDEMFGRGVITNYTLAMDRSKLWVTFAANSTNEVRQVLGQFPIADYVEFNIHQLAFSNSASAVMPEISLN